VAPLITAINEVATDRKNKPYRVRLPLKFPECEQQTNNNDCGPFVCGFIENIINETINPLFEINIENIRKRCHQLRPRVSDRPEGITGGGDILITEISKTKVYSKKISQQKINVYNTKRETTMNLRRFEYFQMSNLIDILPPNDKWLTLSTQATYQIAKNNESYIKSNISYKIFINIDKVFCPLCISDLQWILVVFDVNNKTTIVYNVMESLTLEQELAINSINANLLSFFRLGGEGWILKQSNDLPTSQKFAESGYWIANSIWQLYHNNPPTMMYEK